MKRKSAEDIAGEDLPSEPEGGEIDDESDAEEELPAEFKPPDLTPMSQEQREMIHVLLTQLHGQVDLKLLEWFRMHKDITKEEAELYIASLRAVKNTRFSQNVAKRLIYDFMKKAAHPLDFNTPYEAMEDKVLIEEVAISMGELSAKMGRLRGLFLLAGYILTSHLTNWKEYDQKNPRWQRAESADETGANARSDTGPPV
jgi:hypothetical protein